MALSSPLLALLLDDGGMLDSVVAPESRAGASYEAMWLEVFSNFVDVSRTGYAYTRAAQYAIKGGRIQFP